MLMLVGFSTTAVVAPASAANPPTSASCYTTQGGKLVSLNWKGKDPSACKGTYYLYDISGSVPLRLLEIHNAPVSAWQYFRQGYTKAQQWCASNSLTCAVVTAIGVAIVQPLIAPANS